MEVLHNTTHKRVSRVDDQLPSSNSMLVVLTAKRFDNEYPGPLPGEAVDEDRDDQVPCIDALETGQD